MKLKKHLKKERAKDPVVGNCEKIKMFMKKLQQNLLDFDILNQVLSANYNKNTERPPPPPKDTYQAITSKYYTEILIFQIPKDGKTTPPPFPQEDPA